MSKEKCEYNSAYFIKGLVEGATLSGLTGLTGMRFGFFSPRSVLPAMVMNGSWMGYFQMISAYNRFLAERTELSAIDLKNSPYP